MKRVASLGIMMLSLFGIAGIVPAADAEPPRDELVMTIDYGAGAIDWWWEAPANGVLPPGSYHDYGAFEISFVRPCIGADLRTYCIEWTFEGALGMAECLETESFSVGTIVGNFFDEPTGNCMGSMWNGPLCGILASVWTANARGDDGSFQVVPCTHGVV